MWMRRLAMGHIYLYYGTGGGKTANALGLALRSVGHNRSVVLIQFMKWRTDIGEYRIKDKLAPYYEVYQFGREGWLKFGEGDSNVRTGGLDLQARKVEASDRELAGKALEFARKMMLEKKPSLLILDEICLAAYMGLLSVGDVLAFLNQVPAETDVVMTGRYTPKEFIDRADFVNEIIDVKSPSKFVLTEGIQY